MADTERLHIKLGISGTYWDKRPAYNILFNGEVVHSGTITLDSDTEEFVIFDVDSATEEHILGIQLLNKEDSDTVQSEDKSSILKDMLLNITSLEIDEIDLHPLPYTLGAYTVTSDNRVVKNCVNLGWNGVWTLTWTNPLYIWLLENL